MELRSWYRIRASPPNLLPPDGDRFDPIVCNSNREECGAPGAAVGVRVRWSRRVGECRSTMSLLSGGLYHYCFDWLSIPCHFLPTSSCTRPVWSIYIEDDIIQAESFCIQLGPVLPLFGEAVSIIIACVAIIGKPMGVLGLWQIVV